MRPGQTRERIRNHLAKMPESAFLLNSELERGFTVAQIAEKHGLNLWCSLSNLKRKMSFLNIVNYSGE